ncbi:hypothetical protein MMC26_006940 [Xylographa opegraphella]|nr:hypothetical protein [Xylographa opegraphella]
MAANREERFLMRQRGAGARQLRNSGFSFDLLGEQKSPLKAASSAKSRRTPRSKSQIRASTKRTPKVTSVIPRRSSRRTPASKRTQDSEILSSEQLPSISEQQDAPTSQASKADEQGTVTKKRRLAGRPRTGSLSIYEEPRGTVSIFGSIPENSEPIESDVQKEIVESEPLTTKSGKKRKKRKSVGQKPKKRAKTSLPNDQASASGLPATALAESSSEQRQSELPEPEANQAQVLPVTVQVESIKRKIMKRKPVGAPQRKRKSLDVTSSSALNVAGGSGESPLPSQQEAASRKQRKAGKALASVHEERENETDEDALGSPNRIEEQPSSKIPSAPTLPRRRGRPRKADSSALSSTTTRVSKPSTSKPRTKKGSDPSHTRQPKQKAGSIPITVHRNSPIRNLNHDPTDEDILSAPPPFPNKSGVNAVDVVSQICCETITKSIGTLKQTTDKQQNQRQKAEWQRKTEAVEMFGDELDMRFFQMSEAIDNNHGLATRLRQAKKAKNAKRDALLDIKRQREEVAIEMDAVRAQYETATKITQDENDLDTMIHDIKLAVQRGRAAQQAQGEDAGTAEESVGLELRLRKLAAEVSAIGGGGLLNRVKGFNALMEKVLDDT